MNPIAVYPGSFDPITNGYVDIVRRSLQVFDQVIVAVAFNAQKDSAWFTPEERTDMIRDTFRGDGKRVVADAFSTLLVDYVSSKGAGVIIGKRRGQIVCAEQRHAGGVVARLRHTGGATDEDRRDRRAARVARRVGVDAENVGQLHLERRLLARFAARGVADALSGVDETPR